MKGYISIFSLLILVQCYSQNEEHQNLIKGLSWKSFEIRQTTYFNEIIFTDSSSLKLISSGKHVSKDLLLRCLDDSTKAVVAHLILTKIWEPNKFSLQTEYLNPDSDQFQVKYVLNGLKWKWTEKKGYFVDDDELSRVKRFWMKE